MARVVICGAGIAGVSTAFHLTRVGVTDIVIVDPRPPLTLTSDKSTECYRNWWPNRPMVRLMNRSIELLDEYAAESDNVFGINRRGYLYLTADESMLDSIGIGGAAAAAAGAGDLRVHDTIGSTYDPATPHPGADLFTNRDELRNHFPWVTDQAIGGLHARTAGWLSAQQLGMWMLAQAEDTGVTVVRSRMTGVVAERGEVQSVHLDDGTTLATQSFVNAAGPMLPSVGRMVGLDLPVFSEVHAKTAFRDHLAGLPRSAPMIIWSDPQQVDWSDEEFTILSEAGRNDVLGVLPAGCHARPEGGPDSPWVLGLWEYGATRVEPTWPIPVDPLYTETVLRGLATMTPALARYRDRLPEAVVDGGHYTKTVENRPLAGPAGPHGSYVCGALSGFGIMAACGVGEIVARDIAGLENPAWAKWFDLRRYEDKTYVASIEAMGPSGQI
jgi:glycine/D-amino acid oxidase-like deaminating enzyme